MSNPTTALEGETFDGFARIADAGLRGMITLRGDLSATALQTAATDATGVDFPGPGEATVAGDKGICWMSPDEVLVLCPYAEIPEVMPHMQKMLSGTHHLIVDVSDARAVITVSGSNCREVIAKLTPADVSPAALSPGQFRRTRLAQVPAAFWMRDKDTFEVICFRSVSQYVFDILKAAATPGSEVGYF